MSSTSGGHRRPGRGQRGHGQPGAQRQAGRRRRTPGRAVLTALDVLGYERPSRLRRKQRRAGRPDRARAGQPDLPGVRAGHRDGAGARTATRRCCARRRPAACTRTTTCRCCSSAASPASSSSPACTPTPRPTTRRYRPRRPRACRSSWSTATPTTSTRRSSPPTTARRRSWPSQHLAALGPPADRPGGRAGPVRPGHPQDRRLPAGHGASCGRPRTWTPSIEQLDLFSVEGGAGGGRAAARARVHRDRVRLGPDGARRDPGGARRAGCDVPRRRVGRGLRRLAADRVHRPAADDGAPARAGAWARRRCGP